MEKGKLEKRIATLGELVQEQLESKDDYKLNCQKPDLERPRLKKLLTGMSGQKERREKNGKGKLC